MAVLGLEAKELESVSMADVQDYYKARDRSANVNQDLCDLRYNTLNKRRHDRYNLIRNERNKIIEQENMMYGGQQTTMSQMSKNIASSSIANPMFNSKGNPQMYQTLNSKGS